MADLILSIMLWVVYLVSLYFAVFWLLVWLDKRDTLKAEDRAERKPSELPFVSVIIPAYNEEETIAATVQSVLDLDYPHELLDIMVVNDGSKDNTQREMEHMLAAYPDRLRIIRHETNKGKAASMNDGIAAAKGEYFACLDADSFVDRDTLRKMVAVFEQGGEKLAIVTPAMKTVPPKTFAQKLQRIEYMLFLFVARLMSHIDCLSVAPGPFSLYKTSVVKEVGGFEVGNPTEDMEIAFRMQSRHYRLKQCHDAHVYTVPPATFKELYHQRRYRWFRGGIVNTLKYRHMLLNKAYGDFGLIQMLISLVGYALAFSTIGIFLYMSLRPFLRNMYNLYLVGFDFWPFIKSFEMTFRLLDLDVPKMVAIYALTIISILMFVMAHRNAKERVTAHGWLYLVPYFAYYYLFLSLLAVTAVVDYVRGKKWRW